MLDWLDRFALVYGLVVAALLAWMMGATGPLAALAVWMVVSVGAISLAGRVAAARPLRRSRLRLPAAWLVGLAGLWLALRAAALVMS
jgi:hypothetical protein